MTEDRPPESSDAPHAAGARLTPAQAAAALRWLIDSGADVLTAAESGDWLAPPRRLSPRPRARAEASSGDSGPDAAAAAPAGPAPVQAEMPIGGAPLRIEARTLEALRAEAETLPFAVRRPGAPFVFADGDPGSGLMIVGEAPGAEEERQGRPFVGPAGQLLDRMLAAIGLGREEVYITNLSPWRPGANRVPNVQEAAELLPLLQRHIALVQPRALLLVGGASAKAVLGSPSGIMRLRGRWHEAEVEGARIPAMPTFHPAYLLRDPAQKRLAWQDLLALRARLNAQG